MRVDGFVVVVNGGFTKLEELPRLHLADVVVWLAGIVGRRRCCERGREVHEPAPLELSNPGGPMSRAPSRSTPASCDAVRVGRTVQTQAAIALTIGAEKLVPSPL